MASQAAKQVRNVEEAVSGVRATLELECGCIVTRQIAADRILQTPDGPMAVGKYPCPKGHPVKRV